jgi:thiol:disulfide interchange protein DsbC
MPFARKTFAAGALLVGALAASFGASADDALLQKLKEKYPGTTFTGIAKAPIGDLFEVTMGRSVAYTDKTGDLFVFGRLYDMKAQKDLTADRLSALSAVDWNSLPLKNAITIKKGTGARVFAYFSDPDCPFCKKLEQELSGMDNFTAYIFLLPLDQLHPDAPQKAKNVWCSKDRAAAWLALMLEGKEAAKGVCDTPLQENATVAAKTGAKGTPFLVRGDGVTASGYMPKDRLDAWLSAGKTGGAK